MLKTISLLVVILPLGMFAANPAITGVTAELENPWHGKVYISYVVTGDIAATAKERGLVTSLKVTMTDNVMNTTYKATKLTGDIGLTEGRHSFVWDMAEEGLSLQSPNIVFTVSCEKTPARYCVVDLSAGSSATSYPITYLTEPVSGGFNTDEYKTTKLALRCITSGSFFMGGLSYNMRLTKPFFMGIFEVTQKQYELVTGNNPSNYKGDMRPEDYASWEMIRGDSSTYNWPGTTDVDASTFMGKIRARTGLKIDLPTQAQWEYACRAGTTSSYNNGGNTENDLKLLGRYSGNRSDGKGGYSPHTTVGSYLPNAWGLYDMHGNVWEWCLDWYWSPSKGVTDPIGPSSGTERMLRGGCWNNPANSCASSGWYNADPPSQSSDGGKVGFRLARTLSTVETEGTLCSGSGTAANLAGGVPWGLSEYLSAHCTFDSDAIPWRTVYANKTRTVEGALPTLSIPDGVSEESTVYLWTESTNVAYLANGDERIYHALDHQKNPKDYLVYAANIVHATNFTFKVRGARGAAGQTTTIYLSTTPTNVFDSTGALITNFVSRTISVAKQSVSEVLFELEPASITCDPTYGTAKAQMTVTVDAFTNDIVIALNPTVGVGGPALPAGILGISTSPDGALSYMDTITVPARSSMDDDPQTFTYYIFGLGFATNETFKTTSPTIVFSPTIAGDGGAFFAVDPFTIDVREGPPSIALANVHNGEITAQADELYPITLTVSDSYANLHDTDRGYEIWWRRGNYYSSWMRLISGVAANSDGELNFNLNYFSGGSYQTSIRVVGPDGKKSDEVSFTANVAPPKYATLVVDKDTDEWYPRQYFEGDTVKNIRIELQNWKNDESSSIYAFLEPLGGTENYITSAEFLTTTAGATGLEIWRGATNTTATAQFTILDALDDPGLDLNFNIILRDKKNWDDAGARTLKTFLADSITVYNVFPAFTSVTMSGGTRMTVGDGTETQETYQGIEKTFTWSVCDVAADMPGLMTVWTVYDPSGSGVDEQVFTGDPATPLSYKYKFLHAGTYYVTVRMCDKDMLYYWDDDWPTFRFNVNVGDAPKTVFSFPDGTDGSERYHFNERAVLDGFEDWFQVGISTAAKDPIVVKVMCTRIGADGILDFDGADEEDAVYVTIPAGQSLGGRVDLSELDGTKISSKSSGGFMITATVTNTNLSADGVPYNEVYASSSVMVFVDNVAPIVCVDPAMTGTNNNYEESISANEDVEISWEVEDVPADVADNVILKWTGLPATAQYVSGASTSPTGTVRFSFHCGGRHTVTLNVRDKDGGSSETFEWVYDTSVDRVEIQTEQGTTVTIPAEWLNEKMGLSAEWCRIHPTMTSILLNATAANERKVWQCYMLGLDPEQADDDFRITRFWMDGNVPMFEFNHTSDGSGNTFVPRIRKMGSATPTGPWQEIPAADNPAYRFFKAEVLLP